MKPTIANLRRLVGAAGGTLEEDFGRRDMRTLQACSPSNPDGSGKRWSANGCLHLRIEWAKGSSPSALAFNADSFTDAQSRVAEGLEEIPEDERGHYASE